MPTEHDYDIEAEDIDDWNAEKHSENAESANDTHQFHESGVGEASQDVRNAPDSYSKQNTSQVKG